MKCLFKFSYLILALVAATTLCAGGSKESFHRETRQRDFDAVQRFVNSRRTIPFNEKQDYLTVFGDVRAEYKYAQQRFPNSADPSKIDTATKKSYDAEANLKFKYKCDNTEAFAKVYFDASMGIEGTPKSCENDPSGTSDPNGLFGSGSCGFICLKECWIRHTFSECDGAKAQIFIGRSGLDKYFESRLQFSSRFNGIMLSYSKKFQPNWNVYAQVAGFVVDERSDHYAAIGEIGTHDFMESKIDVVYNYIYWKHTGESRCGKKNARGARFCNSQIWLAYNMPDLLPKKAKLYGAFIYNHCAKKRAETLNRRQNCAWNVGFLYGKVSEEGDYSVETQYQSVQAQAINEADQNGIGRGNFAKETFTADQRGGTNYHGFKVASIYAITDQLTAETSYQQSWALEKQIGGKNNYYKWSFELIHTF